MSTDNISKKNSGGITAEQLGKLRALEDKQLHNISRMRIAFSNFKKSASKMDARASYVSAKIKSFQELWSNFIKGDSLLYEKTTQEEKGILDYYTEGKYEEIEEFYHSSISDMEERLGELKPNADTIRTEQNQSGGCSSSMGLKLPTLNVPKFGGDYREWTSFFDMFRVVVDQNDAIPNVRKLNYLKSYLTAEAEQLLRHIPVEEGNYSIALNMLKNRYNNKRLLVDTHIKTLMEIPSMKHDTAKDIRNILDTTNECLQALKNLGLHTENWDPILVYITSKKLHINSRTLWEQGVESQEPSSWDELAKFIETRFRTLETIGTTSIESCQTNTIDPINSSFITKKYSPRENNYTQHQNSSTTHCPFCNDQHFIQKCTKFRQLKDADKWKAIDTKGLCPNCLRKGHSATDCLSTRKCYYCKKSHNTLLHSTIQAKRQNSQNSKPSTSSITEHNNKEPSTTNSLNTMITTNRQILLATALINVENNGKKITLRALLDQGSEQNFITTSAIKQLHLKGDPTYVKVCGLGNTTIGISNKKVNLTCMPAMVPGPPLSIDAFVLDSLSNFTPTYKIKNINWDHIKGLALADPKFYEPGQVDLLLGAEVYSRILEPGVQKGPVGTPTAQHTIMGWILSGKVSSGIKKESIKIFKTTTITTQHNKNEQLDEQLLKFWEIEEIIPRKINTEEENLCEKMYAENTTRDETGRYVVKLPFKCNEEATFGRTRSVAIARLYQLESTFRKNEKLKSEYVKCLNEYLLLDHMVEITQNERQELYQSNDHYPYNYLPHHSIYKESSTTTKLRVVFDASTKVNGTSLNEKLMVGPTIQNTMTDILMKWRVHKIALTADITKMYRQIGVSSQDQNYQRIVWRDDENKPIKDFKLKTVTFGTSSAPFLAIRTLQQLANDEKQNYPIASRILIENFYVDDVLTGADTLQEANHIRHDLSRLLEAGGFELRKWSSNSRDLLQSIPPELRETTNTKDIEQNSIKTLGIHWNPDSDMFLYKVNLDANETKYTKRTILSEIAKLFDPLGWVAPTIIMAKIIMQKLWTTRVDWDEVVPHKLHNEWIQFKTHIYELEKINIPRWLITTQSTRIQIHGFCDASTSAYAAAVYLRTENLGIISTTLLAAKTKVAPLKCLTIPRLELNGAKLLAELMKNVTNTFENSLEIFNWSDSEITLAWIAAHPSKWTTFVANRVSTIQSLVPKDSWYYVPSAQNPADCASRGLNGTDLKEYSLWWHGPSWLQKDKEHWPTQNYTQTFVPDKKNTTKTLHTKKADYSALETILQNYSSLPKILRIIARCKRVFKRDKSTTQWMSAQEIKSALQLLILYTQKQAFQSEWSRINERLPIDKRSKLLNLNPFCDENGIIRVGGRLQKAGLNYNETHQIILPNKSRLTELIIDETHRLSLHGGTQLMMGILRQKYWILNCRNTIRYRIHKCISCHRQRAETAQQLMGNLPLERSILFKPFAHTGIDYCGPLELKMSKGRSNKTTKGYIVLFICMSVKAIHLEVVSDLTAETFLAAFRRFTARRSVPTTMFSDNGTTFVKANKNLDRDLKRYLKDQQDHVAPLFAEKGLDWKFIPPGAPHQGGIWERGVRSVKHHLLRTIGTAKLTFEELTTVLTQIEACLNSRPLCPITEDPDDYTSLTPAHFLTNGSSLLPLEEDLTEVNLHRLRRWQYIQQLQQIFWKRWHHEYLHTLQPRKTWKTEKPNVKIGQLVLIKDENLPPARWAMGRITKLYPGADSLIRVVDIQTQSGTYKRPITKLCILPVETVNKTAVDPLPH